MAPARSRARAPGAGGVAVTLRRHRRVVAAAVFAAAIVGFVYFVVPQLSGLPATLKRLRTAEPAWIGIAVACEALSLGSYVLLFRTAFSCAGVRIGWRESYQITMAGVVASKLLAAAGAGGVALTVWALRAAGLEPRAIARRMLMFELLLYSVFACALIGCGIGLRTGVLPGRHPWTLTVVPAAIAAAVVVATLSLRAVPADFERRIQRLAGSSRRGGRLLGRLASAPGALREGTGEALSLVRERNAGVAGAIGYWSFDIATLWACMHAFGAPPPLAAIVMAYFVGQLANALPLPGGIGGVEGGMIGAFLAFGTHASLAVLGVLCYRAISFWLPTLPGALAYVRLRGTVAGWREAATADD